GRFRQILRARGITSHQAAVGTARPDAYTLAQVESAPLPQVLMGLDHDSDNFEAELLLKELGAEIGGAGTTAAGAGAGPPPPPHPPPPPPRAPALRRAR